MNNKSSLLHKFAHSCFDNEKHKNELEELLILLNLTKDEVVQAYVDYDMDIFAYGNEIYDPLVMRMVLHLHNLLDGSWHIERQNAITYFMNMLNANNVMDIGFGIPSKYTKELLNKKSSKIVLTDIADSAMDFARALFQTWKVDWKDNVTFICEDMVKTSLNPPKHDIYLFQDSIEHVEDSTACLNNFVKNTHKDAKFILSLPIGQITPMHYIAWDSEQEIVDWLKECNLKVIMHRLVKVNPEVDLFAEQHKFNYTNMIVTCRKL